MVSSVRPYLDEGFCIGVSGSVLFVVLLHHHRFVVMAIGYIAFSYVFFFCVGRQDALS
jgi:hypothetical protein